MRRVSEGIELRFWAAVHSIESGDEERLATFYVLNTSLNLNNWRVTDKALEDALPGLMGKTLNCIPGYRVNHVHEPLEVGKWIRVEKPDGYALATAEITDDVAWEKLKAGEWGPVSVVIRAFKVTCSVCGEDITGAPDEHVVSGEGHEVIESFRFERVDFVSRPAYPQSDLLNLGHVAAGGAPVLQASQSKVDGPQGAQGNLNPDEEEEKKLEAKVEELQQELETLKADNTDLKTRNEDLEGRLEQIEAERHQERVDAAVEARAEAGLVNDREAETERLKELDDATLILLAEDAGKVAEKLAKAKPIGPKAKHTAETATAFDAAVEDTRMRLFGHRKEADA
jgi:hypothetical protein